MLRGMSSPRAIQRRVSAARERSTGSGGTRRSRAPTPCCGPACWRVLDGLQRGSDRTLRAPRCAGCCLPRCAAALRAACDARSCLRSSSTALRRSSSSRACFDSSCAAAVLGPPHAAGAVPCRVGIPYRRGYHAASGYHTGRDTIPVGMRGLRRGAATHWVPCRRGIHTALTGEERRSSTGRWIVIVIVFPTEGSGAPAVAERRAQGWLVCFQAHRVAVEDRRLPQHPRDLHTAHGEQRLRRSRQQARRPRRDARCAACNTMCGMQRTMCNGRDTRAVPNESVWCSAQDELAGGGAGHR
jgi:hypothetical protein